MFDAMTDEEVIALANSTTSSPRLVQAAGRRSVTCPSCERPVLVAEIVFERGVCFACDLYWTVAEAHDDRRHDGDFEACTTCIPALRAATAA